MGVAELEKLWKLDQKNPDFFILTTNGLCSGNGCGRVDVSATNSTQSSDSWGTFSVGLGHGIGNLSRKSGLKQC